MLVGLVVLFGGVVLLWLYSGEFGGIIINGELV